MDMSQSGVGTNCDVPCPLLRPLFPPKKVNLFYFCSGGVLLCLGSDFRSVVTTNFRYGDSRSFL